MGSACSCKTQANMKENRVKVFESKTNLSLWYEICRDGDLGKLIMVLPFLTFDQLNRIEPNGSTCLHVACYKNHFLIVSLLLACGCDRNVKNKFGLTPLQETTNEDIRCLFKLDKSLLERLTVFEERLEKDILAPCNKFLLGHISFDDVVDAKKMMEAYRMTGITKMYMNIEVNATSYISLRTIINRCIPSDHPCRSDAIECLDKQDPFTLIKLYTLETDFYPYLQDDNAAFTANIFINLAKFRNRAFKGRTYRGIKIAHFDMIAWKWATKKEGRIIETQTFLSTSESEEVARGFAMNPPPLKVSALFTFYFEEKCDTAIQLTEDLSKNIKGDLTQYPNEKEVLVTPYTLFKVNTVDFDETTQLYQIHLTHIPIHA